MLAELEQNILLYLQSIRNDAVSAILVPLTKAGDGGMCWILMVALLLIIGAALKIKNVDRREAYLPLTVGAASAASLALSFLVTNMILKKVIARVRPYEVINGLSILVEKQKDLSFPSGHASAAFAVAVAILIMMPKKTKWIGVLLVIIAVIISFSRLYVGVHYPTDVIAGAAVGIISAILMSYVVKRISKV